LGYFVATLSDRQPSLASASRYAAISERCPVPARDSESFLETTVDVASRHRIDVVLPMTEISTLLLTHHRERLPSNCRLPFPSYESVRRASNKAESLELARSIGVPVPESRAISSPSAALDAIDDFQYPVVIKPACSRVLTAAGWISNSVSYAAEPGALRRRLSEIPVESYPVLLQERINGPGVGVFMLFDRGRAIARFSHRRLREKPPSGGVSVLSESIGVDPDAADQAERLLKGLEWHGPAMVEFKRDERDGSLRLMEINGRFWGSLQLAIDAGVDFPALLVDIAMGTAPAEPPGYRSGVRCRWLSGDLDSLLLIILKRHRQLNLPASHAGRLKSLWNFLRPSAGRVRYEIERRDDLGPARLEWRRRFLGDGAR
jgi:predicted ATP-grasp superfamily ATP-dependent carboligase